MKTLLLLLLVASGPAAAAGPALYPTEAPELPRQGTHAQPPLPHEKGDGAITTEEAAPGTVLQTIRLVPEGSSSIHEYERAIEDLQAAHGAYDHRLTENLLGLGLVQRNQGDYQASVASFEHALHVGRINEGLHNLDHVPLVELIIDGYGKLSDWEQVDRYQHYLYWINRRGHASNDPAMIPVLHRVASWNLTAYGRETGRPPFSHLDDALTALDQAAMLIQTTRGVNDPRLVENLYASAITHLYMAAYVQNTLDASVVRGRTSSFFADPVRRDIQDAIDRQNFIAQRYRRGRDAIKRAIEIETADQDALGHAVGLTYLADWYLMFDRRQTAKKYYVEAYEVMNAAGVPQQQVDALLGRPIALPALRIKDTHELAAEPGPDAEPPPYVLTAFDVTSTGRVRNIRVIEAKPADDSSLQRRARRELKNTRFRPRVLDGETIETAGVELRYVFPEEG